MQEAKAGDQLVRAGPDSPEKAQCPVCGATVVRRKRRRMDGDFSWFYRHVRGNHVNCPLRYSAISTER